jgi:drug/metabolite transporter (DMT)-like permease
MSNNSKAILWMVFTSLIAVMINSIAKKLQMLGLSPVQIMMLYGATALPYLLGAALYRKSRTHNFTLKSAYKSKNPKLHFLRAILEFSGFSLLFTALNKLELPMHTAITFISPIMASIIAVGLLKEPNSIHRWLALLIGFAGVMVITHPWQSDFKPISLLVVLGSAMLAVCAVIIKIVTKHDSAHITATYMLVMTTFISLPAGIYFWEPVTLQHAPYLLILGLLTTTVQHTVAKAFGKSDMTIILPFQFLGLVWASIFGFLIFDEVVTPSTIIGGFMIVFGVVYCAYKTRSPTVSSMGDYQ